MKIHFIVHEVFEAPGALETWVANRGYDSAYSRVYLGDKLPEAASLDMLVVLGGPQSPATTLSECPHFDASAEVKLIQQCIQQQKAVVGVCLGAQLIGEALGAQHEQSPFKEIGSFPITLTESGKLNQKLADFPVTAEVGHWHGDMPGLTEDAEVLAVSAGCPRQIVEYSNLVYGFQCHLEFNSEVIELLIKHSESELSSLTGEKYVESPSKLRSNNYEAMNQLLFTFLDKLLEEYAQQLVGESLPSV